ncbi:hypothetical protein M4R22_09770 [Acidovorax sp. GBBC 3334]|uniref:hypothetical protein n=1 Tax=Acidovorax sp. GBBC 3334 TaxID=2940496 RepID=UPI00230430FD|nr:hypothetical protein [Acidovorax sp. GBBC 3334]MDA8455052.1 hypothetical protein [Acidovorax sp. GBBC 3334]
MPKKIFLCCLAAIAALAAVWIFIPGASNKPDLPARTINDKVIASAPLHGTGASAPPPAGNPLASPPRLSDPGAGSRADSALDLLSSLSPPEKPAWQILKDYQSTPSPGPALENKVIATLSYCLNIQNSGETILSLKSRGEAVPQQIETLEENVENHAKFCSRLLPTDFQVRSDIIRRRAEAGDTKAMMAFPEVGPQGYWPSDGAQPALTDAQKAMWQAQAMGYLSQAAKLQETSALNALAAFYGTPPAKPGEPSDFFSNLYDPVQAYAYAYAWTTRVFREPDPDKSKLRDLYLQRFRSRLNDEQYNQAQKKAEEILSSMRQ